MGGVPTGQAAVSRRLNAAILLLLFWSAASAEVDPGVYLERQVLVPFRLEDFRIREDNLEQIPLSVDLERRPLCLVLAVDISGSMADSLPSVRQAACPAVRTERYDCGGATPPTGLDRRPAYCRKTQVRYLRSTWPQRPEASCRMLSPDCAGRGTTRAVLPPVRQRRPVVGGPRWRRSIHPCDRS